MKGKEKKVEDFYTASLLTKESREQKSKIKKDFFFFLCFALLVGVMMFVFDKDNPTPDDLYVNGWKSYTVTIPKTRVWNLVKNYGVDPRLVLEIVKEKNPGLAESNYDIGVGQKILLPTTVSLIK